jgi:hypothetical protein
MGFSLGSCEVGSPIEDAGGGDDYAGPSAAPCAGLMLFVRAYPPETQEMVFDARDRSR